ncbi:hypothetical protein ACNJX9_12505 [Bradyrhizobium sp. DASA03076]|jgi:hypothetical protein|uniref:Uncharacterized protein n=1 Tax=Bradyrhizobium manausense TaxID=989370 RepID=A0A0R3DN08_9BRAD|nr:hypothetical protein [Bradyrhizobium manausense]KRQ09108.1 hypothetical protein AOQ71_20975 [Bradyrhizobium manausense]
MPTVCRFYDDYADGNRVILSLDIEGGPVSDASLVSNNCDAWYIGAVASNLVPLRKHSETTVAGPSIKDASAGAGGGATVGTAARLITMLVVPGIGPVVGVGWLAAILGGMAAGGVTGGLLSALTNAGINEEGAHVLVEGVRRGGTLVAARAAQEDVPRIEPLMNCRAVNLEERSEIYRKAGWLAFDPKAPPYTADQVRCERALHGR